jgi:aryl-alcohol dehydrogenase-like predicted oxidoreductase
VAERRGRERLRTEQPPYSILTRAVEYDVLPTCLRHGMGVLAYSPLAGGWLSGRYRKDAAIDGPGSPVRRQRFADRYASPPRPTRPSSRRSTRSARWPTRPA